MPSPPPRNHSTVAASPSARGTRGSQPQRSCAREALRLPLPSVTVQRLDPAADADLLATLGLPPVPRGVAYACVGTSCSPPVDRPEALLHAIEQALSAPAI